MVNCNVGKPFRGFERGSTEGITEGPVHMDDGPRVATDSDSIFSLEKKSH